MAELSDADIRKVAKLARLTIADGEVAEYRAKLSTVVSYIERLRELDLRGVEPLTNVGDCTNRLAPDEPGPTLSTQTLLDMAPEQYERFIKVPKVLGDGGGA